jgi:hypothetical protein
MLKDRRKGGTVNLDLTKAGKKPYNTPVIRVYGEIHTITQNVNMTHPTMDSANNGNNKT